VGPWGGGGPHPSPPQGVPGLIAPAAIAAAVLVVGLAATMKGALGFGFPLLSVPTLASIVGARPAVLIVAVPALLANVLILLGCRRHRLEPWFLRMAAAVLAGAVAGALLFGRLPARALTLGLGIVTLGLVALLARRPPDPGAVLRLRAWAPLAGLLAGALGGATDISGPGLVIFLTAAEGERDRFMFALMILYVVLGAAQLATLGRTGLYTPSLLAAAVLACLPMAAGVAIGSRIRARLSAEVFRRAVLAVVVLSALNLLRQGIWG
jgi:uncharacterized membrane protein YfcA